MKKIKPIIHLVRQYEDENTLCGLSVSRKIVMHTRTYDHNSRRLSKIIPCNKCLYYWEDK